MTGWSNDELRACVVAYFQMAENDAKGVKYKKTEVYRDLSTGIVSDRSEGSIERRMCNISHVFDLMGEPWVKGLKPLPHVGANIIESIRTIIMEINDDASLLEPTFDQAKLNQQTKKLRKRGFSKKPMGQTTAPKKKVTHTAYARRADVRAWVLDNAKGVCELCNEPAPFSDKDGEAFLEVHHVAPLAESLRDTTDNAVAVCPNCHKRCHYGSDKDAVLEKLYNSIGRLVRI
jgi:5-methylcytosine-specific restriction protein A